MGGAPKMAIRPGSDRGSVALHQDIGTSTIQPLVAVPDHANSRDTAKHAITGKMHIQSMSGMCQIHGD